MGRILIGNIKGPQGAQGIQGPQGPVGATGPQGPMPDLINNAIATQAGVAALDAAMGKTLQDQITELYSDKSKIGYIDIDVKGVAINKNENNTYYSDYISFEIPNTATAISATMFGSFTPGVTCILPRGNAIVLQCCTSCSMPTTSERKVRVAYSMP